MTENNIPKNQIDLSTILLKDTIKNYKLAVDMTLGNGYDAKRILRLNDNIKLIGFDIQDEAILNSKKTLKMIPNNRFKLIKDSHVNVDKYIEKADLFIYNLGYMPGGNKNISTKANTTLKSLAKAINLLNIKGLIIMIFYLGHSGGKEEYKLCNEYLRDINQKNYTILEFNFINQKNDPPRLICIERIR